MASLHTSCQGAQAGPKCASFVFRGLCQQTVRIPSVDLSDFHQSEPESTEGRSRMESVLLRALFLTHTCLTHMHTLPQICGPSHKSMLSFLPRRERGSQGKSMTMFYHLGEACGPTGEEDGHWVHCL